MSDIKRVYHPAANAWKDVPDGDVKKWSDAGWLKSKPKHADDSDAHKPGDFYSAPVAVEPTSEKAPAKKAETPVGDAEKPAQK